MALQPCRECGEQISTSAKTCPRCGVARPARSSGNRLFYLIVFAVVVVVWAYSRVEPVARSAADAALAAQLDAALATQPAAAEMPDPATSRGTLKVDRVWEEDHDYAYALASYHNDGSATFRAGVTVRCDALGDGGRKINTNTRSFFAHEHGPITPGFTGTVKVPVQLNGATLKSMSCWIESAR